MVLRIALMICFLLPVALTGTAQSSPIDSLWLGLSRAESDSARSYYLVQLCAGYYRTNSDSAILLGQKSLEYAQKVDKPSLKATSLNTLGAAFWFKGDQDRALEYYFEALSIAKDNGLQKAASTTLGNIGIIYSERQDLENALKYQKQSFDIKKELGDSLGMARAPRLSRCGVSCWQSMSR